MLNSAENDFLRNTLGALSGTLGKLVYIAGLRQEDGRYLHWGLARVYGEASANFAIGQAHANMFLSFLEVPIHRLWEETKRLAQEQNADIRDYLGQLIKNSDRLIPPQCQGEPRRQFESILMVLSRPVGLAKEPSFEGTPVAGVPKSSNLRNRPSLV